MENHLPNLHFRVPCYFSGAYSFFLSSLKLLAETETMKPHLEQFRMHFDQAESAKLERRSFFGLGQRFQVFTVPICGS